MRIGRLFFAGSIFLGLAYFALRSPLPVADPRFIREDFGGPDAPISVSVYLDAGYPRDRAHQALAAAAARVRAAPDDAAALEAAVGGLQQAGIRNLMFKSGGTLLVRGKRGNAPWRVGVRKPGARGPDDVLAYLLEDRAEALCTRHDEMRGAPVSGLRQVTVVAADAPTAAQAAEALFAAGPDRWREQARQLGIEQALAIGATGEIAVTQALGDRLKFLHSAQPRVVP